MWTHLQPGLCCLRTPRPAPSAWTRSHRLDRLAGGQRRRWTGCSMLLGSLAGAPSSFCPFVRSDCGPSALDLEDRRAAGSSDDVSRGEVLAGEWAVRPRPDLSAPVPVSCSGLGFDRRSSATAGRGRVLRVAPDSSRVVPVRWRARGRSRLRRSPSPASAFEPRRSVAASAILLGWLRAEGRAAFA
jgi:hypothetical protein